MKNPNLYTFVNRIIPYNLVSYKPRNSLYLLLNAMIDYPDMKYGEQCKIAAKERHCAVGTIKKNIWEINNVFWEKNRAQLFEMAGQCLVKQPTDKEFLKMLLEEFNRTGGVVITSFATEKRYEGERKNDN